MTRRILSLLLALCMVLTLLPTAMAAEKVATEMGSTALAGEKAAPETAPAPLAAEEPSSAEPASGMDHLLTDGKLEGTLTRKPLYATTDNGYYTDVEEAIELLRTKMVERRYRTEIPLRVSKEEVSGETEMEALILGMFALATAHTGVANEGDYLLWQIKDLVYSATYSETSSYYYLDITFDIHYYTSSNDESNFTSRAKLVLDGFGFTKETDDYTKILSIYTFICDTVAYDYENLENESYTDKFTAETALRDGKAVCQGYALLLYYMLLSVGIDCRVVAGYDAETGVGHAWNIVLLDGVYYNLDSTWDAGYTDYAYFLKSPASFTDHIREDAYDSNDFHTLYPMAQEDYTLTLPVISSGSYGENAQYTLYADGYLEITGTGALRDWDNDQTPWRTYSSYVRYVFVDGGISRVGNRSFSNMPYLLAVELSEGLETIGDSAFYRCERLAAVYFPTTIQSVGETAFYCINKKPGVVLISDLTAWCGIDFATAGSNPLSNGADLYLNEEKITDLVIPEGVTAMGPHAFAGGTFTSVTFHPGVKSIGADAFYDCKQLTEVRITDLAAWCAIDFVASQYSSYNANPLSLGAGLYLNGVLVTELVVPESVTRIGSAAFYGSDVTSVTIPAGVTEIGSAAFGSCKQLKGVYITDLAAWCKINFGSIDANPLYNKAAIYLNGQQITDLVIDTSVASIEPYAFAGADIASATVVNPSVKIRSRAFAYSLLTSLTLPEGFTELGEHAFAYSALESLSLPSSLTVIAPYAFYETALTSLVLPEGVTEVGVEAFSRCLALAEITVPKTLKKAGDRAFHRFYSAGYKIRNVYITDLEAWCKADFVNDSSPIGNEAYLYLNGQLVTDLVIPEGIEVLKSGSFSYCLNEMTVTLPQSLTRIETNAFAWLNCKTLYIPENVTYVGVGAFYGAKLEYVSFGGVEHIDKSAFDGCFHLKSVDFGDSLHELGGYAFNGAHSLESVIFPASLEKLGDRVLFGCFALKTITFEGDAPSFGDICFDDRSVTAYYPAGNSTWTEDVLQNYGGKITWVATCIAHTPVTIPGTATTCTEDGLTDGAKCAACGEILTPQEIIPQLPHTFVDGVCTVCGAPEAIPGDFTGDDLVTNEDVSYLLWHTLFPQDYPLNSEADFTGDGIVTNEDVSYLLWHTLFPNDYPLMIPSTADERGKKR